MARSSSTVDWETLKPKILRLLPEGRTRKAVIEELSRDSSILTKSQLEYQLMCWGHRTNLSEQAWRYTNHKVHKRSRNKKDSAVFFNGARIPRDKVLKETRRHDRPTLLRALGGSPKCPEGFDLRICTPPSSASSPCDVRITSPEAMCYALDLTESKSSLPWMIFAHELQRINSAQSRDTVSFSGRLETLFKVRKPYSGVKRLEVPNNALPECANRNQDTELEAVPHQNRHCDPQVFTDLGLLVFQTNKLLIGSVFDYESRLLRLGNILKTVAKITSKWESLLIAGARAASRSLIEQLFELSINKNDKALAEMMLRIGADPDQRMSNADIEIRCSALDLAVTRQYKGIIDTLLSSGAVCGQMALKYAIIEGDLDTATRMLESNPSLDVNFNYLDGLEEETKSRLQPIKLETVSLLGLLCLQTSVPSSVEYDNAILWIRKNHRGEYQGHDRIADLGCLLQHGAAINLDTMILASFSADVAILRFLIQKGGEVCGLNFFGSSCLAAASLREKLQYETFDLLLRSGATVNIPRTHHAFGFTASPFHCLCLRKPPIDRLAENQLASVIDLLIDSGADIDDRIQHPDSPSQLTEAFEKFLWSQTSYCAPPMEQVAQAKVGSPLEYAIIAGNERSAIGLVRRGCQFTGREIKLAVRWCRELIAWFFLEQGVNLGKYDIIDALQYPGQSALSAEMQLALIRATPDLERRQVFGLPLLELCCLKFSAVAVREILRRFPAAYDSGALSAIVRRVLKEQLAVSNAFLFQDIQTMVARRTESNCDWEKESTAVLVAVMSSRPWVVSILAPSDTVCAAKPARLPKEDFSWILDSNSRTNFHKWKDPTYILGCGDWVACSPLLGIATMSEATIDWSVCEGILAHLLSCSYKPDAITVVVAAAKGHLKLVRRLERLENWESIVSIDNNDRPSWCPTALQAAVLGEYEELVDILLGARVSVNELPASEPIGDLMPRTALQAAAEKGNLRLTNLLIERGACINAPAAEDSGATALQLACIHGYLEISIRLLDRGADVNARGALKYGRTALEGAAEHGRIDTIQLLLNHGACTDGSYRLQYLNAVVYAEKNGHFSAAALLQQHREWSVEDEECYKRIQSGNTV